MKEEDIKKMKELGLKVIPRNLNRFFKPSIIPIINQRETCILCGETENLQRVDGAFFCSACIETVNSKKNCDDCDDM